MSTEDKMAFSIVTMIVILLIAVTMAISLNTSSMRNCNVACNGHVGKYTEATAMAPETCECEATP